MTEELVRRASGAHPMGASFCGGQVAPLGGGGGRGGVGGTQGVASPPTLHLRLGGFSQGRAVSVCWGTAAKLERSNFSWGFILPSEKEQVKVKLQLT